MSRLLLTLIFLASSTFANIQEPTIYQTLTAQQKALWHEQQALESPYKKLWVGESLLGSHSLLREFCGQHVSVMALAVAGFFSPAYLSQTFEKSGYPAGWDLRSLLGHAVHRKGVAVRAKVFLKERVMGLSAGRFYPATVRFSEAFIHLPFIVGNRLYPFRTGFRITIHQDYHGPDMTLFLMPPDGLNGRRNLSNPLDAAEYTYTNWLDREETQWHIRGAEKITFRVKAKDSYTQLVTVHHPLQNFYEGDPYIPTRLDSLQVWAIPTTEAKARLEAEQLPGRTLLQQFTSMAVTGGEPEDVLFDLQASFPGLGRRDIGQVFQVGSWQEAETVDRWISAHRGWLLQGKRPN